MPNWCNNTVEISHEDPAMIVRAKQAFNEGKFLNEFIPVPEDLHIVSGRAGADDSPEQIALVEAEERNIAKYGYKTWYDFCVNEWGTKWDVGGDDFPAQEDSPNKLTLTFDSAWAPPCNAYEKLVEQGFSIRAMYYEPGMGFAGIWTDGDDDFYDYSGLDSKQIAEILPEVLDEAFGISECAADWEEENKEEENE